MARFKRASNKSARIAGVNCLKLPALASILTIMILLPALAHGAFFFVSGTEATSIVAATGTAPNARLEVWSPDLHSSNITSTSLFPVGSQFTVRVHVTDAGPIDAFDVTLNYNITHSSNILQAVKTGNELSGGLLDPNHPPGGCAVGVLRNQFDVPAGYIRLAVLTIGPCTVPGTGTLFSITFQVTGIGASFIDIVRTSSGGRLVTTLVGGPPAFAEIPFAPVDARFQNVAGIPPVARFSYDPGFPLKGDTVSFVGGKSSDPDGSAGSAANGNGIARYLWMFGDGYTSQGANSTHVFVIPVFIPASGNFTVTLVVWDLDDNLPGRVNIVVSIARGIPQLDSVNWSGYAIAAPDASVTDVRGSWIVPAIQGQCGTVEQHAAFWVGIDGFNSQTVEQTGTDSACINGSPSYTAWYEFFPHASRTIHSLRVSPGDLIYAEVSYRSGRFNLTIAHQTTGASSSRFGVVRSPQLSSAEWVTEAPSGRTGVLPLTNFGLVKFGQSYTGISGTCAATVSSVTGPIGSFGPRVARITMVTPALVVKALTSDLSPDKAGFTVLWESSGP